MSKNLNNKDIKYINKVINNIDSNLYVKFIGNNIVINIDNNSKSLEYAGYYGEKIIIELLKKNINSYLIKPSLFNNKDNIDIFIIVGNNKYNKIKSINKYLMLNGMNMPNWFKNGIDEVYSLSRITDIKNIKYELIGNKTVKIHTGISFNKDINRGIAKYIFELGANKNNFNWFDEL